MIAQDDELDAILGELTVLESQFDQVSKQAKLILDPDQGRSGRLRVDLVRSGQICSNPSRSCHISPDRGGSSRLSKDHFSSGWV